jgi:hypothetical protein
MKKGLGRAREEEKFSWARPRWVARKLFRKKCKFENGGVGLPKLNLTAHSNLYRPPYATTGHVFGERAVITLKTGYLRIQALSQDK